MKSLSLILTSFFLLIGMTEAAVAAPAAPIIAAVTAPTLTGAALRIGLSLAVSFVTNKLFAPDIPESNSDISQAPDQGVVQRVATNTANKLPVVYGESRVFGSITFADITSDNQTMAFIISLCEGPIQNVDTIYWDSYSLSFNGDINTGLRPVNNATDGDGNSNDFLNGNLRIRAFNTGGRCDEMEKFSTGKWGTNASDRTMPNIAYLYVELDYNREKQVTGLTSKLGAVIKGKRVRNITKSGTEEAKFGSVINDTNNTNWNNPALCLADYLTNNIYGCGNIISDNDLDLETFYSHKNFCNNTNNGDGNTTRRYTTNGIVNTNDTRDIIISDLTSNSQSIFAYQLGKYQMISDTTGTPIMDFNDDNTYGDVTIVNDGINSLKNSMSASYISKNNRDKESQVFVEVSKNDAIRGFNENELVQDTRFKFINNKIEAERALTVLLNKSRDTLIVSFSTDTKAFKLQVNDVIRYTNNTYNFTNKLFKINSISETQLEDDLSGYTITAQEYDADHYNYSVITAEQLAPNTNLPNPNHIGKPANVRIVANSPTVSEKANNQISLSWNAPSNTAGVSNIDAFEIFYATAENPNNRIFLDRVGKNIGVYDSEEPVATTLNNIPNGTILFSVRAISALGNIGDYSDYSASGLDRITYTRTITPYDEYVATVPSGTTPMTEPVWLASLLPANTFTIYAYTKGNTGGTRPDAGPTGGLLNSDRTLNVSAAGNMLRSTGSDNATYVANLIDPSLNLSMDTIYRTEATVTGTTIGTWSRPTRFLFNIEDLTTSSINVTRYGAFKTDSEALLNRPTSSDNFGLNNRWVSNPDLLGVENNDINRPVQYTHTITQFGNVQSGRPSSKIYDFANYPTITGSPYTRTIRYTGPTPLTQYEGQQLSSYIIDVNTGVNSSTATNTKGSGAGYVTNAQGDRGYLISLTTPTGNITPTTLSSADIRLTFSSGPARVFTTSSNVLPSSGSSITRVAALNSILRDQPSGGLVGSLSYSDSGTFIQPFHGEDGTFNQVFIRSQSDLGTLTQVQIRVNGTTIATSNALDNSGAHGRYSYNFDIHSGLNLNLTRNGSPITYTSAGAWSTSENWSVYLNRLATNLAASPFISTATLTNSDTDLRITFVSDAATYGASISVDNNGNYDNPSLSDVDPVVTGNSPSQSSITFTPTLGSSVNFNMINQNTRWYYSDAYLNQPIEGNYNTFIPSTLTGAAATNENRTRLLNIIAARLNMLGHIDADVTGTNSETLRLRYTATATYTNPQAGPTTGFDGRSPNAFINFGQDNAENYIRDGLSFSLSVGHGAGNLVTAVPIVNLQTYDSGTFDNYPLYVDSNTVSIYQQIINAANVLYRRAIGSGAEAVFNSEVDNNTITFTTIRNAVDPSNAQLLDIAWQSDELTVTGPGFTNSFTNGSGGGEADVLRITRTKSTTDELYDLIPQNNTEVIDMSNISNIAGLITEITNRASKLGVYVNSPSANRIQIQDAGTSGDEISITSSTTLSINEISITPGKRPILTDFDSNRWTRPVNTGKQV